MIEYNYIKLLNKILLQAIYDVFLAIERKYKYPNKKYTKYSKIDLKEVCKWFNSNDIDPFTFKYICIILELNSKIIRTKINYIVKNNIIMTNERKMIRALLTDQERLKNEF